MNDNFKRFLKVGVCIGIIIFIVLSFFSFPTYITLFKERTWKKFILALLSKVSTSLSITVIIMFFYNKYFWKCKFVSKLHSVPILHERYEGYLVSKYDDFKKHYKYEVFIKQTFLSTNVILKSGESMSNSLTSEICISQNQKYLIYTYINSPNSEVSSRSSMHYGTARLCIDNVDSIQGSYYTSRGSFGDMYLTVSSKSCY